MSKLEAKGLKMITEFVKGTPYFLDTESKIKQYNYLSENIDCDILIVGGGINGAICSYFFSQQKIDCVLIEKNRFGFSSTSCATAILEYQLDDHAKDLKKFLPDSEIAKVYEVGRQALVDLDNFFKEKGNKSYYSKRYGLVFTQKENEIKELMTELDFRNQNDFKAEFFTEETNPFEFKMKAGLMCVDGGAEFNPYLFTKQMLEAAQKNGARLFENTEAVAIDFGNEKTTVTTQYGNKITCKKVVCATGFNTKLFTSKKLCDKFVSYTIVTSQIKNFDWKFRALCKDNSEPYHYFRLTPDNRIVMGGEDIPFKNSEILETKANEKYAELEKYILHLFPDLKGKFRIDFKFCGTFAATNDNLALIGPVEDNQSLWFCVGYGANGIVHAIAGAQMMAKLFLGEIDENLYLFSPSRKLV